MENDELIAYLRSLKPGERVQETDTGSCLRGRGGVVYLNAEGSICVRWDKRPGEAGQMGTTVTGGTRRLCDCPPATPAEAADAIHRSGYRGGWF